MLTVYLITAVVGGAFVLLSAFGGSHDDFDHDADFDSDAGFESDAGLDADFGADADHGELVHADVWLPFLSMRFWTYFLTFFGVTGMLLDELFDQLALATQVAFRSQQVIDHFLLGL